MGFHVKRERGLGGFRVIWNVRVVGVTRVVGLFGLFEFLGSLGLLGVLGVLGLLGLLGGYLPCPSSAHAYKSAVQRS